MVLRVSFSVRIFNTWVILVFNWDVEGGGGLKVYLVVSGYTRFLVGF